MCSAAILKLLHDGHAVGNLRWREVQGHVARHPEIALRVQGDAADADPGPEGFHLGRIVGGKPHDRVRLGVADPDAVLCINGDAEGRL